jgi:hypothetical protein
LFRVLLPHHHHHHHHHHPPLPRYRTSNDRLVGQPGHFQMLACG